MRVALPMPLYVTAQMTCWPNTSRSVLDVILEQMHPHLEIVADVPPHEHVLAGMEAARQLAAQAMQRAVLAEGKVAELRIKLDAAEAKLTAVSAWLRQRAESERASSKDAYERGEAEDSSAHAWRADALDDAARDLEVLD